MRIRWGAGVIALALVAVGCVPNPAGHSRAPTSADANVGGSPSPTPAGPTPTLGISQPTPLPSPPFTTYKVKKGDTLTSIAKRFATTARSIAYWNRPKYPSLDPESPTYKPNRIELAWLLRLIPHSEVDPEDLATDDPSPSRSPVLESSPTPSPAA